MNRRSVLQGLFFTLGAALFGVGKPGPAEAAPKTEGEPPDSRHTELTYNGVTIRMGRTNSFRQCHEVSEDGFRTTSRYDLNLTGVVQLAPGQSAAQACDALSAPGRAMVFRLLGRRMFSTTDVQPEPAFVHDRVGDRTVIVCWAGSAVVRDRPLAAL